MVKKLNDMEKVISEKPKQSRRRYVRKLNPKLPKLDVKDFLPKLKGKTGEDLKREVMKIRETLESEYQQLKKRVDERKQKARDEINTKSTETLKKEDAIKLEKQSKIDLENIKKSEQRVGEIKKALEASSSKSELAVQELIDYLQEIETPQQILARSSDYSESTNVIKKDLMKRIKNEAKGDTMLEKRYARNFITADPDVRKDELEKGRPLGKVILSKDTKATRASEGSQKLEDLGITVQKKPSVKTPVKPPAVLGMLPVAKALGSPTGSGSDSDSEGDLGGAGFAKIKKHAKEHNIALLGKEEMIRLGDESISLKRQISQLNELKRNRSVVIRRSDLIDAERPINYELSIL